MNTTTDPARSPLSRATAAVALAMTTAAVTLHALFLTQSGALWRDEICSFNFARLDSLSGMWSVLQYHSFPMGWYMVLRGWIAVTPEGDGSLRVLGVLVGLALIAVVWLAGRSMTGRVPILAIALLLFDAATVRFGDSIRGYGLGMVLAVAVYWSLWRLGERRDFRSFFIAAALSVLSVHVLYYNAVVVFASCVGAASRGAWTRSWRDVLRPLAVGAIAAASLTPYLSVFDRARSFNDSVRCRIDLEWIHGMWVTTHASSGRLAIVLWDLLLVVGVLAAILVLAKSRGTSSPTRGTEHHAVAFLSGTLGYIAFLFVLSYYMAPWYYLAYSVLAALSVDSLLASRGGSRVRLVVLGIALLHLAAAFGPASAFVAQPMTNADQIAREVERRTTAGDLVVVTPWQVNISWARYYQGPARSISIPPVDVTAWHRYDLFLEAMRDETTTTALMSDIDRTLASGRRVLLVRNIGERPPVPADIPPPLVPGQGDAYRRFEEHIESSGARLVGLFPSPVASEYERLAVWEIIPAQHDQPLESP